MASNITIADMTRRDAILKTHRGTILDAARRHHATSISRGEDTENSDCDFLADFAPGTTYFNLSDLAAELRALLGCEIDIILSQGLKPRKRHRILEDAINLGILTERVRCGRRRDDDGRLGSA